MQYYDAEQEKSYTPYVIETSIGLDRMFLAVFSASLQEDELENGSRIVMRIPSVLAPYKAAILQLVKKDGLPELARSLYDELKFEFQMAFDEKDAIGKRYRRQDAIGTPLCITVDHQSLEDGTVTLRDRDSMSQKRVHRNELSLIIKEIASMESLLKKV